jgi:hypothetical protein
MITAERPRFATSFLTSRTIRSRRSIIASIALSSIQDPRRAPANAIEELAALLSKEAVIVHNLSANLMHWVPQRLCGVERTVCQRALDLLVLDRVAGMRVSGVTFRARFASPRLASGVRDLDRPGDR